MGFGWKLHGWSRTRSKNIFRFWGSAPWNPLGALPQDLAKGCSPLKPCIQGRCFRTSILSSSHLSHQMCILHLQVWLVNKVQLISLLIIIALKYVEKLKSPTTYRIKTFKPFTVLSVSTTIVAGSVTRSFFC